MSKSLEPRRPAEAGGAAILTLGGIASAFGVAACCALPILLTAAGLSAGWLGGIAMIAAPYRTALLVVSALCLAGGAILLWRQQRAAARCRANGACTPLAARIAILIGLLMGVVLLYLGYSYV